MRTRAVALRGNTLMAVGAHRHPWWQGGRLLMAETKTAAPPRLRVFLFITPPSLSFIPRGRRRYLPLRWSAPRLVLAAVYAASPPRFVTYMYVVSAKITFLPLNLSPSQSYYQHGHDGTPETRGVFDGEHSSYFLHAPSAPRSPFNTCKTGHLYVHCERKNNFFVLKLVSFSKLLSTRSRQYLGNPWGV